MEALKVYSRRKLAAHASLYTAHVRDRTYREECERAPVHTVDTFAEVADSEEPAATDKYLVESHWIRYTNSKKLCMNPCHHLKRRIVGSGRGIRLTLDSNVEFEAEPGEGECRIGDWVTDSHAYTGTFSLLVPDFALASAVDTTPLTEELYLPLNEDGFAAKLRQLDKIALDTMIPKMDTGFSLPVFLFEIAELRFLWKDLVEYMLHLPSRIWRYFKRPLREISQSWLSANFGWVPFINDIKTIVGKLWTIRQKVEQFIDNSNKRLTYHFQKALSPETFRPVEWFQPTYGEFGIDTSNLDWEWASGVFNSVSFNTEKTKTVRDVAYHATLYFQYHLPVAGELAALLAGLDYFGVNLSIKDIWEIIPFSFVIDWVLDVGSWLRRFDISNLPVKVVVYDYCRSIKYLLEEETAITGIGSLYFPDSPDNDVSSAWRIPSPDTTTSVVESYYRRTGIPLPEQEQLPNFTFPSGWQWVTAGALWEVLHH